MPCLAHGQWGCSSAVRWRRRLLVALVQPGWLSQLTAHWVFTDDWSAFFQDLVFFLAGYVIYSSFQLRAAVRQHGFAALVLGVTYWGIVVVLTAQGQVPAKDFSPASLLFVLTQTLSAWLLTLALLGLAMRYLTVPRAWQRYLTSAAFPVYLIHMPVLTVVAYYLLKISAPWYLQLLLITVATISGSFAIYDLIIRRTPVTRLLFSAKATRLKESGLGDSSTQQTHSVASTHA